MVLLSTYILVFSPLQAMRNRTIDASVGTLTFTHQRFITGMDFSRPLFEGTVYFMTGIPGWTLINFHNHLMPCFYDIASFVIRTKGQFLHLHPPLYLHRLGGHWTDHGNLIVLLFGLQCHVCRQVSIYFKTLRFLNTSTV